MAEHLRNVHTSLNLEGAASIVDAAIAARKHEVLLPLAVAGLDAGGQLVAFEREDGCGVMRFDIAFGMGSRTGRPRRRRVLMLTIPS